MVNLSNPVNKTSTSTFLALIGNPKPSRFQVDIVFVLDASVNPVQYIQEKEYVKLLFKVLNYPNGQSRAGIVVYGDVPLVVLRFDGYKDESGFRTAVSQAPYLGGARRVDHALYTAGTLFDAARSYVPWIMILVTAGKQAPGTKEWSAAMEPLHTRGVWPYVVSIGGHVTLAELGPTLVDRSDAFAALSFRELPPLVGPMARHIVGDSCKYFLLHC